MARFGYRRESEKFEPRFSVQAAGRNLRSITFEALIANKKKNRVLEYIITNSKKDRVSESINYNYKKLAMQLFQRRAQGVQFFGSSSEN